MNTSTHLYPFVFIDVTAFRWPATNPFMAKYADIHILIEIVHHFTGQFLLYSPTIDLLLIAQLLIENDVPIANQ